jgi:DNA-binding NtrC family response regulator
MEVMPTPVLLVDDDEFARGFVRTVLERAGYEVHEAEDVAAALAAARTAFPHVVVTDWNLPDGNGGALARALHVDESNLPVILITGEAPGVEPLMDEASGEFSAILHKPFAPSVLEKAIHSAIHRQRSDSQVRRVARTCK